MDESTEMMQIPAAPFKDEHNRDRLYRLGCSADRTFKSSDTPSAAKFHMPEAGGVPT